MRFTTDLIIALIFWSLTAYSTVEVYQFFREASIKQVSRGLSSTVKFTEALLSNSK